MHFSTQVKPISYLKANAAQVLAGLSANREPLLITQNGEAKAVLQDVASYEQAQETLALLKVLALPRFGCGPGQAGGAGAHPTARQARCGLMASKAKQYQVLLTQGAEQDLEALYDYIAEFDSQANANSVLDRLGRVVSDLAHFPERGSYPKELLALGIKEYRQTSFKPYRVIYRVLDRQVLIYLIVDGRRDMQSLLSRRLLAG